MDISRWSLNSDHIPTIISLSNPVKCRSFFSHKLNTSRINWKQFTLSLLNQHSQLLTQLNQDSISPLDKYDSIITVVKFFRSLLRSFFRSLHLEHAIARNLHLLRPRGGTRSVLKQSQKGSRPLNNLEIMSVLIILFSLKDRKLFLDEFYALPNAAVGENTVNLWGPSHPSHKSGKSSRDLRTDFSIQSYPFFNLISVYQQICRIKSILYVLPPAFTNRRSFLILVLMTTRANILTLHLKRRNSCILFTLSKKDLHPALTKSYYLLSSSRISLTLTCNFQSDIFYGSLPWCLEALSCFPYSQIYSGKV